LQFGGRYLFQAPRAAVWAALNDTEVLRAAVPGCKRIDWTAAHRYTLSGRGRGGMLGMAEGAAHVVIEDAGANTVLQFTAVGGADGGIMKLGKALIGNSAQKLIDGFFARFGEAMGAQVTPLPE